MDCAHYLENTANRQEDSLPKGVYQSQPATDTATQPSPHDITANNRVPPCVINYGINGGRLPPNAATNGHASPFAGGDCKSGNAINGVTTSIQNGHIPPLLNGQSVVVSAFHAVGNHGDHANELIDTIAMEQEMETPLHDVHAQPEMNGLQNGGFRSHSNGGVVNGGIFATNGDVTLRMDVSANRVPIAGKKRGREEDDESDYKRMRKNGGWILPFLPRI